MMDKDKTSLEQEEEPTLEEWRALYDAFIRVRELAPWQWMSEEMVFAVQDPETADIGYVNIMGASGESLGVLVYLGGEGWYGFQRLREFVRTTGDVPVEVALTIPFLQAVWADREDLSSADLRLIRSLGLRFRGRGAWPLFRRFSPGYYPWYLTASNVRFLTHVLTQIMEVAPRVQVEGPDILVHPEDERRLLTRVPRLTEEGILWDEAYVKPLPWDGWVLSPDLPEEFLQELQTLPQSTEIWQVDVFMGVTGVRDTKRERPYIPYIFIVGEAKTGYILEGEVLSAKEGLGQMYERIPGHVLQLMWERGSRPRRVEVRTTLMYNLLDVPLKHLGITLQKTSSLRAVDTFLRVADDLL